MRTCHGMSLQGWDIFIVFYLVYKLGSNLIISHKCCIFTRLIDLNTII